MKRHVWILCLALLLSACSRSLVTPANVIIPSEHSGGSKLAFNQRSSMLASGGYEGKLSLWQLPSGNRQSSWQAHDDDINGIAFISNDTHIITAGYDGYIRTWGVTGNLVQQLLTPAYITDMQVDAKRQLIITAHTDGIVRVWRVRNFSLLHKFNAFQTKVTAVALHAQQFLIAAGSNRGDVALLEAGHDPVSLPQAPGKVYDLVFSPDGKRLTGSGWFRLYHWTLADRQLKTVDTAHNGIVKSLQYTPDGTTLASISRQTDSSVYFLDPGTGQTLHRFFPHELCGTDIRLSPNNRYMATTSDDASVRIWDFSSLLPQVLY